MITFQEFFADKEKGDLVRYLEYKASKDGVSLDEAARRSIGRLFTQIQDSENPIVVMTAFRSERPLNLNRSLNRELANDLRQAGWGFTPVLGGFLEKTQDEAGQPREVRVHEESFFINAQGTDQQVTRQVLALLNKYQQEAALFKPASQNTAMLLNADGSTMSVGTWQGDPKLMATYYTRMRQGAKDRQFTFEAAGDESRMTRMAVDQFHKRHET